MTSQRFDSSRRTQTFPTAGSFGGRSTLSTDGGFLGDDDLGFLEDPAFGRQGLQAIFSSNVANLGLPFNQQQSAGNFFNPLYNQYLGFLANEIRGGGTPQADQTFDRFLGGQLSSSGFGGFQNFFQGLGPQQRGINDLGFRPPTSFLR